jgi:hypothetical protein
MGWKKDFQAEACLKIGIQDGADDRRNDQCLFCVLKHGNISRKERIRWLCQFTNEEKKGRVWKTVYSAGAITA